MNDQPFQAGDLVAFYDPQGSLLGSADFIEYVTVNTIEKAMIAWQGNSIVRPLSRIGSWQDRVAVKASDEPNHPALPERSPLTTDESAKLAIAITDRQSVMTPDGVGRVLSVSENGLRVLVKVCSDDADPLDPLFPFVDKIFLVSELSPVPDKTPDNFSAFTPFVESMDGLNDSAAEPTTPQTESVTAEPFVPADVDAFVASTRLNLNNALTTTITPIRDYKRTGWQIAKVTIENGMLHVLYERDEVNERVQRVTVAEAAVPA